MAYMYHPAIADKAALELGNALRAFRDMEYANALLADPRMTSTKGILAACGFSYGGIKYVREQVSGQLPTLESQKRAIEFLNTVDAAQREWEKLEHGA